MVDTLERFEIKTFDRQNAFTRNPGYDIHKGLKWEDLALRLDKAHINQLNTNWDLGQGRVVSYIDQHGDYCQARRYHKDEE